MPSPIDPREMGIEGHVTIIVESTMTEYDSRDYDLIMGQPTISDAAARRYGIDVPGRDGTLDLTEALGGVYYANRTITIPFVYARSSRSQHHTKASELRNLIDGKLVRLILSDDLGYFWRGRCQLDVTRSGRSLTHVTLTMDAEPYKYAIVGSYEPWQWSPFSFVDGEIVQLEDVVLSNSTETVTLPADPARQKPILWLNRGASGAVRARLSHDSTWYALKAGKNTIPEIRMRDSSTVTLVLTGTGSVGVEYRTGSL